MQNKSKSIKELPNGWQSFEQLTPKAEKFDKLLEYYKLQVGHGSSVWVATLLPYDSDATVMPEVKTSRPSKISSLLLKLIPNKMKTRLIQSDILSYALEAQAELGEFRRGIEEGRIDGYYCALTGPSVQECIEELLSNVEEDERYVCKDAFRVSGGCIVPGHALAYEKDTMGQYLMKGRLTGSKNEGQILLETDHQVLPRFSISNSSFLGAYNQLVSVMKETLNNEKLVNLNLD